MKRNADLVKSYTDLTGADFPPASTEEEKAGDAGAAPAGPPPAPAPGPTPTPTTDGQEAVTGADKVKSEKAMTDKEITDALRALGRARWARPEELKKLQARYPGTELAAARFTFRPTTTVTPRPYIEKGAEHRRMVRLDNSGGLREDES